MKKIMKILLAILCLTMVANGVFAQRKSFDSALRLKKIPLQPTKKDFGKPIIKLPKTGLKGFKKGILDCNVNFKECTVMNMPLIWQGDPRVDKDVLELGDTGCYTTSILTVISTALANRKTTQEFQGRTKILDSFVGDAAQPKEIKQLSYIYRQSKKAFAGEMLNGKKIDYLYFHEVVADFNKGKIIQSCNPYVHGGCDADPAGFATNFFADGFRHWVSTETITNENIISLMEQGYVVMIAYVRYTPSVTPASAIQKKGAALNFKLDSFHKVVFSGFRKGEKYPLIINDVGNGQRYNVRLSTDLSQRNFGQKTPILTINYPNDGLGANTQNFIEYEGTGGGIGEQVFFLDHFDGLRIK